MHALQQRQKCLATLGRGECPLREGPLHICWVNMYNMIVQKAQMHARQQSQASMSNFLAQLFYHWVYLSRQSECNCLTHPVPWCFLFPLVLQFSTAVKPWAFDVHFLLVCTEWMNEWMNECTVGMSLSFLQRNLSRETTAMRDHLSWQTTHFLADGPTFQHTL